MIQPIINHRMMNNLASRMIDQNLLFIQFDCIDADHNRLMIKLTNSNQKPIVDRLPIIFVLTPLIHQLIVVQFTNVAAINQMPIDPLLNIIRHIVVHHLAHTISFVKDKHRQMKFDSSDQTQSTTTDY